MQTELFQQKADMLRGADISPCARYRYRLWRKWSAAPVLPWVMLNPSTADGAKDDPTVRRVVGFSKKWGYGGCEIVNLFGLRATDPGQLLAEHDDDAVGRDNDEKISSVVIRNGPAVVAWGAFGSRFPRRVRAVLELLGDDAMWCLGVTRSGHPRHPLYVPGDTERQMFVNK